MKIATFCEQCWPQARKRKVYQPAVGHRGPILIYVPITRVKHPAGTGNIQRAMLLPSARVAIVRTDRSREKPVKPLTCVPYTGLHKVAHITQRCFMYQF
jgi:hypothetical protein